MKLISRTHYLQRLIDVVRTPDIKIVTGIRRSGKSKLLLAFKDYIEKTDASANIIHIDFNDLSTEQLAEYHALHNHIIGHRVDGVNNYVLIDEVQTCEGFEKAINSLHASEQYDIYITGSNAFLMSSDLATLFTGRTIEIEVYPFSLAEFCTYYELSDLQAALDEYVVQGGMSGAYTLRTESDRRNYVYDVFRTLIMRDVKQKYKIRNPLVLDKISEFLMDNISNISSLRNVTDELNNNGIKVDNKTVNKYVQHLCQAFLFYQTKRFDIKGKRYLATQDKYYLADHSFRYALLGTRNMDYGRVYENIVAIELKRRGYEVYAGYLYKKEIDFVAIRQNEKIYIQVSDNITEKSTFEREVSPLFKIRDAYPKMLIARTRHDEYDYEGIRIIDLPKWLAQQ